MKTGLLIVFFLQLLTANAQVGDTVMNFRAEELNGNVYLTWSIKQGFTCNGMDVYRSIDSAHYTKIGDIEGICGSSAAAIAYDFTDQFPEKNTRNYYRLSLGGVTNSHAISIDIIDISANKYLIVPNPVNFESDLYFENASSATCVLTTMDGRGIQIISETNTDEVFQLRAGDYASGTYWFRIDYGNGNPSIAGSFVVP
ncbi:MAG: hypothetical protein A3D92_15710 [Bacteroidetes bacterium RIFCSPHIGHO2_02_FULL_44_7]|nr:MAG: hypothetical protein A3D92_15710 [Bacteroidetes bacterium RIFCSPHIGHO2_02_FULL_44_7]